MLGRVGHCGSLLPQELRACNYSTAPSTLVLKQYLLKEMSSSNPSSDSGEMFYVFLKKRKLKGGGKSQNHEPCCWKRDEEM